MRPLYKQFFNKKVGYPFILIKNATQNYQFFETPINGIAKKVISGDERKFLSLHNMQPYLGQTQ